MAINPSDLDFSQCIRGAYDDATSALRVNAQITAPLDMNGQILVDISATDGDSVIVYGTQSGTSGGTLQPLKLNSDGTVPVTGAFYQSVQPISATSLPLPTNAAKENGGNLDSINSNLINFNNTPVQTVQLFTKAYDSLVASYPTSTQEVYQTYVGGLSGTLQQTITINYTDSTKNYISSVVRT